MPELRIVDQALWDAVKQRQAGLWRANLKTIKRETLEGFVLDALRTQLMRDDLVDIFNKKYTRHMNRHSTPM
ncbi:MAG: hypothetical protein COB61_009795 [Thiotrichales bacterium]|nr:hypothetical protein [Thiotrichales bacterium]